MQPKQIAKKIRKILLSQKLRLEEYLELVKKEDENLLKEDPDKLIAHIDLERQVVDELDSLKKIAKPLEIMYLNSSNKKNTELVNIKNRIGSLSDKITTKSINNREKLETILVRVKADLKEFSKPKTSKTYDNIDSNIVDICG